MKIIVVSPRFPYPLEKGDKLRLYHQLKSLAQHHEIVLVSLTDCPVNTQDIKHIDSIVSKSYIFNLSKFKIAARLLGGLWSKLPFQVLYFYNPGIKRKIHDIITKEKPDAIYNQLLRTAEYTRDIKSGFKVLDYMDSFSQGMYKRLNSSSFPFRQIYKIEYKRLKKYEEEIFHYFDKHTIISQQDKDSFPSVIKDKLYVIPNGVDTHFFSPRKAEKIYDLGFVGNMGYRPNVIASEYLVREIYPALSKKYKDIKVLLAGARPHARVKKLADENITVSGWMEDIRMAYAQTKIFIAPIFTGIGQQNKILEAMSMEIPVVTTTPVNNAIGAENNKNIIVADDKNSFIKAIISLLEDPAKREETGKNGRDFVKNNYSWQHHNKKLLSLFEKK